VNWPVEFNLKDTHCADVLSGCYDLPVEAVTVLDIGANVGAFARWASQRWPEAAIHCYEPQPVNYSLLKITVKHYGLKNVFTHENAVSDVEGTNILHENGYNCGEWSFIKFDVNGHRQIPVLTLDAASLPLADFIKIDTEGMEPNIIKRLCDAGRLAQTKAVVLEYHAATHVAPLIWMLYQRGFKLHDISPHMDHRGILKFIR